MRNEEETEFECCEPVTGVPYAPDIIQMVDEEATFLEQWRFRYSIPEGAFGGQSDSLDTNDFLTLVLTGTSARFARAGSLALPGCFIVRVDGSILGAPDSHYDI